MEKEEKGEATSSTSSLSSSTTLKVLLDNMPENDTIVSCLGITLAEEIVELQDKHTHLTPAQIKVLVRALMVTKMEYVYSPSFWVSNECVTVYVGEYMWNIHPDGTMARYQHGAVVKEWAFYVSDEKEENSHGLCVLLSDARKATAPAPKVPSEVFKLPDKIKRQKIIEEEEPPSFKRV